MAIFGQRSRVGTALSDWGFPTTDAIPAPTAVDFLVVGAGAGGGGYAGGGAGGYRCTVGTYSGRNSALESQLAVSAATTYTITIGAGSQPSPLGRAGDTTIVAGVTTLKQALGGGGSSWNQSGSAGGCGGGSRGEGGGTRGGGAGTAGEGFDGGSGSTDENTYRSSGSGGGAGGAGSNGQTSGAGTYFEAGTLNGLTNSITGTSTTYSRGGGASYSGTQSANTGNGSLSGNGGSGIVVISYSNTLRAATTTGSPTFANSGGKFIYTFTGSGTIVWNN